MFIKIASDTYVNSEDVIYITSYSRRATVSRLIDMHKQDESLLDCTSGKKIVSIILLMSGQLILSPTSLVTLISRLNQAKCAADRQGRVESDPQTHTSAEQNVSAQKEDDKNTDHNKEDTNV